MAFLIFQIFCYQSLQLIERCTQTVLEAGGSFAGVNRKVQLKPTKWTEPEEGSTEQPRVMEALLILKHGGVLTHAGRQQVRHLTHYQGSAYPETVPRAVTCWQAAVASSHLYRHFPVAQCEASQPEAQPVLCAASGRCAARLQCCAGALDSVFRPVVQPC